MSTILFDCVFNLLLDFLKPIENEKAYRFKGLNFEKNLMSKAYADDLSFVSRNPTDNQHAIDRSQKWLTWSQTMRAKPKKCVWVGFKRNGSNYSAFNPNLTIKGEKFAFMFDPSKDETELSRDHFKFLGRWIPLNLKENKI